MNLTIMLLLHDFSVSPDDVHGDVGAGPSTPRPADPSPEGGESEPVGDDDDEPEEREEREDRPAPDVE